ncbi:MAG: pyridoxal phosphate-dependent aminotransferase [Rhodocyclaceae bacterium]
MTDPLRAAARMAGIAPFHVVELLTRARALEAQGRSVIHMEVGEPDFPTPAPMLEEASRYLVRGDVHYTPSLGIPELREAIAGFYATRYGLRVDPGRVVVTAGASAALLLVLAALVDPGAEVLMADPGYPCNRHFVRLFGGLPRAVPVGPDSAYQMTPERVEAAWTPATRAVLVASPSNPTGTLVEPAQMQRLAPLVRKRGGALLVDEIYHGLTYGSDAMSALAFDDEAFVINSFSKYFGMTGWRLGWLVAPQACVRDIEKLAQNLYICPSGPAQYAALAAFRPATIEILEARRAQFRERRDFLLPALGELGFTIRTRPEGAFYLYAETSSLAADSQELSWRLLEEAGVAITPGLDFGENRPEAHVRFAYTSPVERLEEGVERLRRHLRG